MSLSRAFLAAFMLAAPLVCAQQPPPKVVPNQGGAATHKARPAAHEPLEINLQFKRIYKGKLATCKTYTLEATTNEDLPALRDDTNFRASATDPNAILESNTDVDILALRREAESVFIALRISTQTFGTDVPESLPKLPAVGIHKYVLTPTVPLGKMVTVFASDDRLHDTRVEVQVRVQRPALPDNPQ
jgi:hypothetical protein